VRANAAVNFRTQPSTAGSIIRTLATGERGTVRGGPVSANGYSWCQIQIGSTTGWVASQYLTRVSGPIPTPNGTVTPRPSPPAPGNGSASVVYQGSASSGMIALTFDAGADRGQAAYILDVLADYGAHATFGMTGTWARDNPDLVQRMVAEGHQLINHTWDHPSFTGGSSSTTVLTRAGRIDQLDRTEAIVEQVTGYHMSPYWRPPYGDINASVLSDVYAGGYYVTVMWSCDTLAWNGASEQQILNRCMYPSGAGDIILMHVGADGLDWAATDNMVEYFQNQGLQVVTVEELLAA
jgi:peptidoglycan/xylan/chitin deacetylase (PgdA/CDA1 family)